MFQCELAYSSLFQIASAMNCSAPCQEPLHTSLNLQLLIYNATSSKLYHISLNIKKFLNQRIRQNTVVGTEAILVILSIFVSVRALLHVDNMLCSWRVLHRYTSYYVCMVFVINITNISISIYRNALYIQQSPIIMRNARLRTWSFALNLG